MKKLTSLLLFMTALYSSAQNTTLTGTVSGPATTPTFNGVLQLQLYMPGAVRAVGGCGGSSDEYILPVQIQFTIANGSLTSGGPIWGADCLEPISIPYKVIIRDTNGNIIVSDYWLIQGSTFDIGQAQSAAPSVPSYTQVTQTYPAAGIANSLGSAWGTSYGTTGFGSNVMLSQDPYYTGTLTSPGSAALHGTFTALGGLAVGTGTLASTSLVTFASAAFGGSEASTLLLYAPTGATANYYWTTGSGNAFLDSNDALTAVNLSASALTAGNCVQAGTGGLLTTTGFPCGSGGGGGGGGNVSSTGLINNYIPKAIGSTAIADSSIVDNGVSVTTTEQIIAPSFQSNGPVNGFLNLQSLGTLPSGPAANTLQLTVPNSVTAYTLEFPGSQPPDSAGDVPLCTNASTSVCSWVLLGSVGMVYPGAGIGNSTGSAWGTSYSATNPMAASFVQAINLGATGAGGITGNLPVGNLNSGTGAGPTTFWRGDGTWGAAPTASPSVSWTVASGATATPAAPYALASLTGPVSNCYFTTTTSDGSTNLIFNVKLAGTNIISGTNATVTAGTSAGTISTFSLTSGSITVTAGNKWELDITTGTSSWTGVVQCY